MALLPCRMRPDLRLAARSLLPGLEAAQQARRSGEPKRAVSSPISMTINPATIAARFRGTRGPCRGNP